MRSSRKFVIAGAGLIALVAAIAYYPALWGGFIWDDETLLTKNPLIKAPDGLVRFWFTAEAPDYWPLTSSTFWLEWRMWGMKPAGYHFTNLLLHIATALLIWAILRSLSIPGAFLAALLFAVHPVNVESVAWIAQRKNTLAIFFFLLSILWYLRAEKGRGARVEGRGIGLWYWLSVFAFLLAMLSKGSVAILPVVLLLIVWWQQKRITFGDFIRTAPFFLVAIVLGGVNVWFQTHGTGFEIRHADFAERAVGAGGIVWFYLAKALAPIDLIFVYPQWNLRGGNLLWWVPVVAALAITALLWRRRNSSWARPLLFAWAFFCVALAPVMGFTDVYYMKYSLVADHYQYIALIAVCAMAGAIWSAWREPPRVASRTIAVIVAAAVVGVFMQQTSQLAATYRDAETLYRATIKKNPTSWLAHNNLGNILAQANRPQEAIESYEQALRYKPDYAEAWNNLGLALCAVGRFDAAIQMFHEALRLDPNYPQAYDNLGNALASTGDLPSAIAQYQQALRMAPNDAKTHNNLGFALAATGHVQEAIRQYEQSLDLNPENAMVHNNLASAYAKLHRFKEAITPAQTALDLARSQGQAALAREIESALASYHAAQENPAGEDRRSEDKPAAP